MDQTKFNEQVRKLRHALASVDEPLAQVVAEAIAERLRQRGEEGWTPEHDDHHDEGEIALAAAAYALHSSDDHMPEGQNREDMLDALWPWAGECFKGTTPERDIVKAIALLFAELERRHRAAARRQA